jgi:hypothetical protein
LAKETSSQPIAQGCGGFCGLFKRWKVPAFLEDMKPRAGDPMMDFQRIGHRRQHITVADRNQGLNRDSWQQRAGVGAAEDRLLPSQPPEIGASPLCP